MRLVGFVLRKVLRLSKLVHTVKLLTSIWEV